jgi:hypothetical protein
VEPARIVDAYVKWAGSSIEAFTTGAARMRDVGQSEMPAYDWFAAGAAWMADMTRAALDVYDSLCGPLPRSAAPLTATFSVGDRRFGTTGDCRLTLMGPLQAQMGSATIGMDEVAIVPQTLPPTESEFRLDVWPGKVPGDAYWGKVQLVVDGVVLEPVDVVVQVP